MWSRSWVCEGMLSHLHTQLTWEVLIPRAKVISSPQNGGTPSESETQHLGHIKAQWIKQAMPPLYSGLCCSPLTNCKGKCSIAEPLSLCSVWRSLHLLVTHLSVHQC